MNARTKSLVTLFACVVVMAAAPSPLVAAGKTPAEAAFDRLKSLAGTWETRVDSTRTGVATYTVTGGGNVVLEVMGGMATAYHFDKDTLMMTHYCGAGNQPRMRAMTIGKDGRHIAFQMFDITNHPNAKTSSYSSALDVRFAEDGTVELAFKAMTAGVEESSQTFRLVKRINAGPSGI
ncbi:MAG TPA: hypothetical protein VFV51_01270 [Vicinamibacterales bacterium]|nr:hypothetical protein [Vicinamibacterales bacterium]